jgi:hypothetical protein
MRFRLAADALRQEGGIIAESDILADPSIEHGRRPAFGKIGCRGGKVWGGCQQECGA